MDSSRIARVREYMGVYNLDAVIVLSEDPHASEYPADHWKFREYLSGFTGSKGVLVITPKSVGLWTDSRYWLQAEQQTKDTGIEIFRYGAPGVLDYVEYLTRTLPSGSTVGVDGVTLTYSDYDKMRRQFARRGIRVNYKVNLTGEMFGEREELPLDEIVEIPERFIVEHRKDKLARIRGMMADLDATHYLVFSLDDIAWLLNLRGNDAKFNPVFYAYMIITLDEAHLYVDPHKLTGEVFRNLEKDGIQVYEYNQFQKAILEIPSDAIVFYNPNRANTRAIMSLPQGVARIEDISFIERLKSCKTARERRFLQKVCVRDGVALVRFMHWLDIQANNGLRMTEREISKKLHEFRVQGDDFNGESFETIVAFAENAACPHYTPTEESDKLVTGGKFLLIDSGGHYNDGTTDITRTIALGLEEEWQRAEHSIEKSDYTLVLKGHINLARSVFPQGTTGGQLDTLARVFLWKNGSDYGHGTGHGIGFNLNVHEGPQSISKSDVGIPFEVGMVVSNEPGLYRDGYYGIRIENMMICQKISHVKVFGGASYLRFETLSLCPFDRKAIDIDLLDNDEIAWINNYHRECYDKLSPFLNEDDCQWLENATKPL